MSKDKLRKPKIPKLPKLLDRKIYKTGQTRGADDDAIFQNRVSRNSTVLIPYAYADACAAGSDRPAYENGFIVLLSPTEYFETPGVVTSLGENGLVLGKNALVFYERRRDWVAHDPDVLGWTSATQRTDPLGGQYVARVAATTSATEGERIVRGFDATSMKGAGIRVYEYAGNETISACRLQLEVLFWLCDDSQETVLINGMTESDAETRRNDTFAKARDAGLLDLDKLRQCGTVNAGGVAVCPLCREELRAAGFFSRLQQAEGRLVHDLTVTQINLFHVEELRIDTLNHRPYNLGWGHHHCNVVVRDAGIDDTLVWMDAVVERNRAEGHFPVKNSGI